MLINLIYNLTMNRINIAEAKAHLSRYLEESRPNDIITLCNRNVPVAELRILPRPTREPRTLGLARGQVTIQEAFFQPLPDDLVSLFEGRIAEEAKE